MLQQSKFKIIAILLIIFSLFNVDIVNANDKNIVNIYFFHSDGCSHCQNERKTLDKLEKKYDNIKVYSYEVHEDNNLEVLQEVCKLYNINDINGVPVTVIGDTIYTGFNEEKGPNIFIRTIEYYSNYGYMDKVGSYLNITTDNLYPVADNDISLKEFINSYNNYKLLFNIYSDDIDNSYIGLFIGLLLGINVFLLLGLFILTYRYKYNLINAIKYGVLYIVVTVIFNTCYSLSKDKHICLILMVLFDILYMITRKKNKISSYIFILLISSIMSALTIYIYPNYLYIFNDIIFLNNLNLVYIVVYYIELYFMYMFIPLFILVGMMIMLNRKRQSKN